MRLKFDAFTWVVLAAVVLLVVGAVVTVNLTDSQATGPAQYMTDDTPAAPVFNAIVAVQRGDVARARAEFTTGALAEQTKQGYDPIANATTYYGPDTGSRRIRIVRVSEPVEESGKTVAYVTVGEDTFAGGGLFGRTTYSNERIVRVAREDDRWKVDGPNLFY